MAAPRFLAGDPLAFLKSVNCSSPPCRNSKPSAKKNAGVRCLARRVSCFFDIFFQKRQLLYHNFKYFHKLLISESVTNSSNRKFPTVSPIVAVAASASSVEIAGNVPGQDQELAHFAATQRSELLNETDPRVPAQRANLLSRPSLPISPSPRLASSKIARRWKLKFGSSFCCPQGIRRGAGILRWWRPGHRGCGPGQ